MKVRFEGLEWDVALGTVFCLLDENNSHFLSHRYTFWDCKVLEL